MLLLCCCPTPLSPKITFIPPPGALWLIKLNIYLLSFILFYLNINTIVPASRVAMFSYVHLVQRKKEEIQGRNSSVSPGWSDPDLPMEDVQLNTPGTHKVHSETYLMSQLHVCTYVLIEKQTPGALKGSSGGVFPYPDLGSQDRGCLAHTVCYLDCKAPLDTFWTT